MAVTTLPMSVLWHLRAGQGATGLGTGADARCASIVRSAMVLLARSWRFFSAFAVAGVCVSVQQRLDVQMQRQCEKEVETQKLDLQDGAVGPVPGRMRAAPRTPSAAATGMPAGRLPPPP